MIDVVNTNVGVVALLPTKWQFCTDAIRKRLRFRIPTKKKGTSRISLIQETLGYKSIWWINRKKNTVWLSHKGSVYWYFQNRLSSRWMGNAKWTPRKSISFRFIIWLESLSKKQICKTLMRAVISSVRQQWNLSDTGPLKSIHI